jgi:hypothetical protein
LKIAVGGMYYTAHRYAKLAEQATGISAGDFAAKRPSHGSSGRKRNGCVLVSNYEAPASVEENTRKAKQAVAAISNDSKGDANQLAPGSACMLKAVNREGIEGARYSKVPYFSFTMERENGKITCTAFRIANRLGNPSHCGHGRFQAVCGARQFRPESRSFPGGRGKSQRSRVSHHDSSTTVVRLSKGQTK